MIEPMADIEPSNYSEDKPPYSSLCPCCMNIPTFEQIHTNDCLKMVLYCGCLKMTRVMPYTTFMTSNVPGEQLAMDLKNKLYFDWDEEMKRLGSTAVILNKG